MLIGLWRGRWRRELGDRFDIFGSGGCCSHGKFVIRGIRYRYRAGYLAANGLASFLAARPCGRLPQTDLHRDDRRSKLRQEYTLEINKSQKRGSVREAQEGVGGELVIIRTRRDEAMEA